MDNGVCERAAGQAVMPKPSRRVVTRPVMNKSLGGTRFEVPGTDEKVSVDLTVVCERAAPGGTGVSDGDQSG